jgi:hypothetical protein
MEVLLYLTGAATRPVLLICLNPSDSAMGEAFYGANELIPLADAACLA